MTHTADNDEKRKLTSTTAKVWIPSLNLNFTIQGICSKYGGKVKAQWAKENPHWQSGQEGPVRVAAKSRQCLTILAPKHTTTKLRFHYICKWAVWRGGVNSKPHYQEHDLFHL